LVKVENILSELNKNKKELEKKSKIGNKLTKLENKKKNELEGK
jgi:hypothetical protein